MTRGLVAALLPEHVGRYRLARLSMGRGYAIVDDITRRPAYTEGRSAVIIPTRPEARRILADLFAD